MGYAQCNMRVRLSSTEVEDLLSSVIMMRLIENVIIDFNLPQENRQKYEIHSVGDPLVKWMMAKNVYKI